MRALNSLSHFRHNKLPIKLNFKNQCSKCFELIEVFREITILEFINAADIVESNSLPSFNERIEVINLTAINGDFVKLHI